MKNRQSSHLQKNEGHTKCTENLKQCHVQKSTNFSIWSHLLTYCSYCCGLGYLPPSYQGYCSCSGGPFWSSVVLNFLHFVLLVYSFLIHMTGFSKQICFQSFPKMVNVFTVFNFHWQFIIVLGHYIKRIFLHCYRLFLAQRAYVDHWQRQPYFRPSTKVFFRKFIASSVFMLERYIMRPFF